MDQISPPIRIVLGVAIVFLVAWMFVLKPKNDSGSTPAATPVATPAAASASDNNPAQTSLGKAVEKAHGAADTSAAADAKESAAEAKATGAADSATKPGTSAATAVKPQATTAPKPAATVDPALAKLPTWLQKSIDHKVVALLFVNDKASDDRRTRAALKHASTFNGRVVKRAVPITRIAHYHGITEGVDVEQSPTLIIIDRHRHASAIVGYSTTDAINQAAIDGLLATDNPVAHVKYVQTVQEQCHRIAHANYVGPSAGANVAGAKRNEANLVKVMSSAKAVIANAPVPAAYKGLDKTVNRYLGSQISIHRGILGSAFGKSSVDTVKVRTLTSSGAKVADNAILQLAAAGVDNCS